MIEYLKYLLRPRARRCYRSWVGTVWCRFKGHPAGVWWYNSGALEPDMHCKDCGDNLG